MSSNLCMTDCRFCGGPVRRTGPTRALGAGLRYHAGMVVADAECRLCRAKYVAWVDDRMVPPEATRWGSTKPRASAYELHEDPDDYFFDLSFRHTFNDEPGEDDMPEVSVDEIVKAVDAYLEVRGCP